MASGRLPVADGLRVLVVDDYPDCADSLADVLGLLGHQARACHRSTEALSHCRTFRPHAVFLDLGMPEPSGYQLAGHLRELGNDPAPAVVAVTGFVDEAHRQRARGLFDHYLVKPAEVEDLKRILAGLAGREGEPTCRARLSRSPAQGGGTAPLGRHGT